MACSDLSAICFLMRAMLLARWKRHDADMQWMSRFENGGSVEEMR
jgi:hypothetical protein